MASSVIQAGSPLDDYFNGTSDCINTSGTSISEIPLESVNKLTMVDEAGLSNERDHTAPPPSGTEEAGDTVGPSCSAYGPC